MFRKTVTALAWYFGRKRPASRLNAGSVFEAEAQFVMSQIHNMPDYLRLPFRLVTLFFGLHTIVLYGKPFYKLKPHQKEKVILSWKYGMFDFKRVFVKFYESLVTLHVYSHNNV
jgi:hypothetical protein